MGNGLSLLRRRVFVGVLSWHGVPSVVQHSLLCVRWGVLCLGSVKASATDVLFPEYPESVVLGLSLCSWSGPFRVSGL